MSDRRSANIVTGIITISGYSFFGWICHHKQVTASLFVADGPSGIKTVNYLDYAHMKLWSYLPSYFLGFLLADYVKHHYKPSTPGYLNHMWRVAVFFVLNWIASLSTSLSNTFNLIPSNFNFLFIVSLRMVYHVAICQLILFIFSGDKGQSDADHPKVNNNNNNGHVGRSTGTTDGQEMKRDDGTSLDVNKVDKYQMRLFEVMLKFLSRLSMSLYLANYFFIRSDFFTSRYLWVNSWYEMVSVSCVKSLFNTFLDYSPLNSQKGRQPLQQESSWQHFCFISFSWLLQMPFESVISWRTNPKETDSCSTFNKS